jgi:hypothetical protein
MKRWAVYFAVAAVLLLGRSSISQLGSHSTLAPSVARQMEAFWKGNAHFQQVRDIDWDKAPYLSPREGWGWFGKPMPFLSGRWYLFNRVWLEQTETPG